jgi:hypothetical protein
MLLQRFGYGIDSHKNDLKQITGAQRLRSRQIIHFKSNSYAGLNRPLHPTMGKGSMFSGEVNAPYRDRNKWMQLSLLSRFEHRPLSARIWVLGPTKGKAFDKFSITLIPVNYCQILQGIPNALFVR